MLYDPALVDQLYDQPGANVDAIELDPEHRSWLIAPDRRAYGCDFYRRSRSLTGLLDEYPVSCALAVRHGGDASRLDAFFSSKIFHEGMQKGRSLALDFGRYLREHSLELGGAWMSPMAQIESAVAETRRDAAASARAHWPGLRSLLAVPSASLQHFVASKQSLGNGQHERVLDSAVKLSFDEQPSATMESLLIRVDDAEDADAHIECLPQALYELLLAAQRGDGWESLIAICLKHDASRAEADEILAELVESGDLRRQPNSLAT